MTSIPQTFDPKPPAMKEWPIQIDDDCKQAHEDNANVFQNNISTSDLVKYYSSWATDYEKDFHIPGLYLGPNHVAETLASLYTVNRGSVRVLDVACGTGILGERLRDLGFRDIDGLDPSPGMLDLCRRKNIYTNLICDFMTEEPSDIKIDSYDCLGITGGMGPGHIPRAALRGMIRVVKSGGYICIAMRQEYLDMAEEYSNNKLDDAMDQLEKSGLWDKIERRILPIYFYNKRGVLFLYRVK